LINKEGNEENSKLKKCKLCSVCLRKLLANKPKCQKKVLFSSPSNQNADKQRILTKQNNDLDP
jgi:hypothetical protein